VCFGGDVYWQDSCGVRGALKRDCPYGCGSGKCLPKPLPKPGGIDFCSSSSKCSAGQGNCKGSSDCKAGLVCVPDVGSKYGFGANVDVCEVPSCKDSDNGKNYSVSGGVTTNNLIFSDFCLADNRRVKEYFCKTGFVDEVIYNCPFGCSNGKCGAKQVCTQKASYSCINGDVYWYDSCGEMGALKESCGSLGCNANSCKKPPVCTKYNAVACYDNDVYWYNSCGGRETKKLECGSFGCSNGNCNPPPSCSEGWYCKDGSTQERKDKSCQIINSQYCPNGCDSASGQCKPNPSCAPHWECSGQELRYVDASCNVSTKSVCNLGGETCDASAGRCVPSQSCEPMWFCVNEREAKRTGPDCRIDRVKVCGENYGCVNGDCQPKEPECISNDYYACSNNDVYSYNSCGEREDKAEECGALGCSDGACNIEDACTSRSSTACYSGDVYWYDSCGGREAKKDECGSNECAQGACQSAPACTPKSSVTCYLGASWWVDSCGNLGSMVKNCSGNCENGECKPSPANTLNIGWRCKDSSKMAYYVNGTWISELPCVLGCSNNSCNYPFKYTPPQTKKKAVLPVLVPLAEIIISRAAVYLSGFLLMVGSTILVNESGAFHSYEWPEYGYDWESDFDYHYNKHIKLIQDYYGGNVFQQGYKDICKDQINDNSVFTNRFRQNDGRFVSYNISSGLVVVGTPNGKIVTCFINDSEQYLKSKLQSKDWKPIPSFKILII
ncbi:MAG TPA: hypothetical protein HA254_02695, partial [Candidatus Diapherotrites archaeon]|nr:hypothetical protein [Candidatus Diapherotrites archaeon]